MPPEVYLELQIPVQLDFMSNASLASIGKATDIAQHTTHMLVKPTGWNIHILGLDLHLSTAALARPLGCVPDQQSANALATPIRGDADIPQNR